MEEAATGGQGTPEDVSSAPRTETYHYSASSNPTLEDQLFELVRLSDVPMSKQLYDVVVELLRLNITPSAILHVMRTLRAQATQSTLPPSLQSSRPHTPPPSSQSSSTTRSHAEASKPAQKREKSHTSSASKPSATSLQPPQADKSSRRHRAAASSTQKTSSSRSSEKHRSSVKGGSGGGGKSKEQTQDSSKKVG